MDDVRPEFKRRCYYCGQDVVLMKAPEGYGINSHGEAWAVVTEEAASRNYYANFGCNARDKRDGRFVGGSRRPHLTTNYEPWVRKMAFAFFAANVGDMAGNAFDLPDGLTAVEAEHIAADLQEAVEAEEDVTDLKATLKEIADRTSHE